MFPRLVAVFLYFKPRALLAAGRCHIRHESPGERILADMDHVSQSDRRQTELLDFGMRLNDNIAAGNCDPYLRVADRDGAHPVVAALGLEPVVRLWRRIAAIGGRANVFVKSGDEVMAFVSDIGTADKARRCLRERRCARRSAY